MERVPAIVLQIAEITTDPDTRITIGLLQWQDHAAAMNRCRRVVLDKPLFSADSSGGVADPPENYKSRARLNECSAERIVQGGARTVLLAGFSPIQSSVRSQFSGSEILDLTKPNRLLKKADHCSGAAQAQWPQSCAEQR